MSIVSFETPSGKVFPTPPSAKGYTPRTLSPFETQIEQALAGAGPTDELADRVCDDIDGWVRTLTASIDLSPGAVDMIIADAIETARRHIEAKASPFAVVDEIRFVLAEHHL